MKTKHVPQRMCAGCRTRKPKDELLRITKFSVKDPNTGTIKKQILFDKSGKLPGRGVYICNNLVCLKKVKKIRKLERTFSLPVEDILYTELEGVILSDE